MSYWDEIEQQQGGYDFSELDWQFDRVSQRGAEVTLAIGLRQPRYPECHMPDWAKQLPPEERDQALMKFIKIVVERYKDNPNLVSWQLENEALNHGIGECGDYSRKRLVREFDLVKKLDARHPVVMSLSNNYGLPVRRPIPDLFATAVYLRQYNHQTGYSSWVTPRWWVRLRGRALKALWGRDWFIHELQAEPWGPKGNASLSLSEQNKTMDADKLRQAVEWAVGLGLSPIDLWGGEWWYWRKYTLGEPSVWDEAKQLFSRFC
jgi:hypothetical protein